MSERIQKQRQHRHQELPPIEELPEPVDETIVLSLANLAIQHIDEVSHG